MNNEFLDHLYINKNIKLTELRKDILTILSVKNKPMGAYDILEKLKEKRSNAEPPTVYRVLSFLVENKLIHRIESQNTYVCCSQLHENQTKHQAILFFCRQCQTCYEFEDNDVFLSIMQFSNKNHLTVDDSLIELSGICQKCGLIDVEPL